MALQNESDNPPPRTDAAAGGPSPATVGRAKRLIARIIHTLTGVDPIVVQRTLRTLQGQLTDTRAELDRIAELERRLEGPAELAEKNKDRIAQNRSKIEEFDARFQQTRERFLGFDKKFEQTNQRLARAEVGVNEGRQRFTNIEARFKGITEHFEGDDKRIRNNAERIAEVEKHAGNARQRFTEIERRFDVIAERLDSFEMRHAYARSRMDMFETVLENIHGNPDALWLFANREERMDATSPLFNEGRRRFHLARYEFAGRFVHDAQVADIACGLGYGSAMLARSGAKSVAGVDIDAEAIAYAKRHHGADNVEFLCGSASSLPLPEASVDVVVSFETIEHVPDDAALVTEFARVLRPGGRLICSTPNEWPLDVAPYHVREYSLDSFRAALGTHFDIDEMYNQNSGTASQFNRGQPFGIFETTPENAALAECFIAVCTKR